MKALRTTALLVALLVVPLFAGQAFAASYGELDTSWVPFGTINQNADDRAVLGFWITDVVDPQYLESVTVTSFVQQAYSVEYVKLYAETNATVGLQSGSDSLLAAYDTRDSQFVANDTLTLNSLHYQLSGVAGDTNRFYVAVDAHTDSVNAAPLLYDGQCMEVIILPGRVALDAEASPDTIYNSSYFDPGVPGGSYRLCFDLTPPTFELHFCVEEELTCPGDITVAQGDSARICATNASPDIAGPITIIDTKGIFLLDNIQLTSDGTAAGGECEGACDTNYSAAFRIPDKLNDVEYPGMDADTGEWMICAWAQDGVGNVDTICIQHAPDLTWRIDTRKPLIDSVTVELTTDNNDDGKIALNDCVTITGWGLSNPWEPELELDSMIVDMTRFGKGWVVLDIVLDNNRVFQKEICLDLEVPGLDTSDCDLNRFMVWAFDNACNYDTLPGCISDTVDLDPPAISVVYEGYDTVSCIGIGDLARISADVVGSDIASVTADLQDAGIDELNRTDFPLPDKGAGLYDTIWTVTEPPIEDGKDADNSVPPDQDSDYLVWVTACDDAGNCVSASGTLDSTLDTRVPRPIGFNCPDTLPCAVHARSLPGAVIELFWDRDCDEEDAWNFFVWADSGLGYDSAGWTYEGESGDPDFNFWTSGPLTEGMYDLKIKTEDNCGNEGDFSCEVSALADGTPPSACMVYPDSGKIFAGPFVVQARSEDLDIAGACLWYRLRPDLNDPPAGIIGQWTACDPDTCMYHPDGELILLDTLGCMEGLDYAGWIELLAVSYDEIGNQQDTTSAYAAACVEDDWGELVPGHFLFYWDTSQAVVQVVSVNDTIAPQSACGFNVVAPGVNKVVIDAPDAEPTDLFTIEVFALVDGPDGFRIDYRNDVTMPCTIDVYVENWDAETQEIYVHVTQQWDGQNLVPDPLVIPLCVPPQKAPWVEIVAPHEWQRVPCSKTDLTCVDIWAGLTPGAPDTTVTRVQFLWADSPGGPWDLIEEVFVKDGDYWKTCWNNKQWLDSGQLQDGDEVFFLAIAYSQFDVPDTSHMVKVYLDCEAPQVQLIIEDVINTCEEEPGTGTPKIAGEINLKASVVGDTVDISALSFWYKLHNAPDLPANWALLCVAEPAWSENIFMCTYNTNDLTNNTWYDIRIFVVDQAGNVWFDSDEDGMFDDYTFPAAVAAGAGVTVYVDNEAPQPAISMVADLVADIWNINPSHWLGCNGNAYVQAGNDILAEISVLPSEDSCEAMEVNWYLEIGGSWVSLGTPTQPYHFPVTFNPLTQGLIDPYELEDGWWTGWLRVDLYDALGNMEDDTISLYILDITPSQAIIVDPLNDSYVSGDVTLSVAALNAYEIAKVCYEYRPDGGTSWLPVNGGYADACVTRSCEPPPGAAPGVGGGAAVIGEFTLVWHTLNTVADGVYYLRAVATDCDNNVDDNPRTIRVTVANGLPTAVMEVPSTDCQRACPDDPEVTITYVGDALTLYATASSGAVPIDRVEFMYKDVFLYPDTNWHVIDTDYFPSAGKYSVVWNTGDPPVSDGRYYLKARAYNAAGRYGDSQPVEVSVDNTAPLAEVVSIMGEPNPDGMDITKGDVIDIEVFAMDSLSSEGWTRCYNSGVVGFKVCIATCDTADEEITKCFEVSPAFDGYDTVQWNTSGLEFEGCDECYELWVEAWDCLGNMAASGKVQVYVSDMKAPVTTIGGFDGGYIYAYSSENISTVQFQYADSADANWIPIGLSEKITVSGCYLYKASWDPGSLANGTYQVRAIAHDECSNQNDDMVPVAYIEMLGGALTPYNPAALGAMSFLKNWCTGDMQGIVQMTSSVRTPMVIGKYGSTFECVDMEAHQQNGTEYSGSFDAWSIHDGGSAKFFSSVTTVVSPPPMTGEPTRVTYLAPTGTFDIATVKMDLGTQGDYLEGDVSITIQGGAVDENRYIWVAPTEMPWAPPDQPDILPIGDDNQYATHISFTDCGYCCGYDTTYFGGEGSSAAGAGTNNGLGCCFNQGKYAKIKMSYNSGVDVPAEQLAVAWWDCNAGEYSFEDIYYPATVEGFDTQAHTVEFATTCLSGPFVVVQFLERQCEGSIMVNMLGIEPYCNGYTNAVPRFNVLIKDDVSCVDEFSIKFKLDLYQPGELVTIYDGGSWADGFGYFDHSGYDTTSGIFKAGWDNDSSPADPLPAGDHMATVTAANYNIQTCTDTMLFTVDATAPDVKWYSTYVPGKRPAVTFIITDYESGVNKDAIWIDIYDADESSQPYQKDLIQTVYPDGVDEFWADDTTLVVYLTEPSDGEYMHVVIYDGHYDLVEVENDYNVREYDHGVSDGVGNVASAEHLVFPLDWIGPLVTCGSLSERPIKIEITDDLSGVDWSTLEFYEDGLLICEGLDCVDEEAISLDTDAGVLYYTPDADGITIEVRIKDNAGNLTVHSCVTEREDLTLDDPHNYPNPFDPREGPTQIIPGLGKCALVTFKVYDFAGEFVKELRPGWMCPGEEYPWDGTTDDGTEVANGTYLCYIHARDEAGATKTAVIKITVLKQDE